MSRLLPHAAPVSCTAVSPGDHVLASGSYDRRILLWDFCTGAILRELRGHTGLINGLDWSPDGQWLASAGSDYSVRIWHTLTGHEQLCLRGHRDDVNAVRWSPDGERLASGSFDGTVRVWRRDGTCTLIAAHHAGDVNSVAWFPKGDRLAAASDDGRVSIFEAEDGRIRRMLTGHSDWVDQVAIHPDGLVIASAGLDRTARIWNASSGRELACLDAASCVVKAVTWSADGRTLAVSSYDGAIRLYENGSFRLLRTLRAEGLWNRTLQLTSHGVVTGSFGGGPVLLGPEGLRRFGPAQTAGLNALTIAPDGESGVVCSDDGRLYEVDLERRKVSRVLGEHHAAVLCAAYSPDARLVASGSWDRTLRVWELRTGRCIAEWPGLGDPVNAVVFDASGREVWIGTFNGQVLSWELESGQHKLHGSHHGSIKTMDRRGDTIVSGGRDGRVHRWRGPNACDFAAGSSIVNGVALDPRAERIATVSRRGGAQVWRAHGERLAAFANHPCSAKAVAWSEDGDRVAAVYYDGSLLLWDPDTGRAALEQISDVSLSQVRFTGRRLWIASWDARGTLLSIDPQSGSREELRVAA
ncbi:MAG: WD40 repeat domain-containing protein [Myxococcota bacterium]